MLSIDLLVRTPFGMLCDEAVFISYDFPFEVCCETGVVFCEAFNNGLAHDAPHYQQVATHLLSGDSHTRMTLARPHI